MDPALYRSAKDAMFSVISRVRRAGKVTVERIGSRQPSKEGHDRVCRLSLGAAGTCRRGVV